MADFGQSQSLCGENCENLLKIEGFESRKIASNLLEFYMAFTLKTETKWPAPDG